MEKIDWKVDGMTCSNCALTISKYLQKEGMKDVKVNPIDGRVSFENPDKETAKLRSGISNLGYSVLSASDNGHGHNHDHENFRTKFFGNNKKRFLFCLPFTLVLMLHMFDKWLAIDWLMNPWLQLGLCLPVFIVGMDYFGRSAINSLKNRVPNMNVLIALGATAAFAYSLTGAILGLGHDYLFFETAASIITLVFLGNYMEDVSIQSTQRAVKS
ncbi:MAG: cation-translocating P-type ATPase, partial [Chitinophagaceae bacterium]